MFATLDATTRQMVSPERRLVLLTDTVGFIRRLPHHLVASFHSTLHEVIEADLLLHVIDASDPAWRKQMEVVDGVLEDLLPGPRPTAPVFNKADLVLDEAALAALPVEFPGCFVVSGATGEGLGTLREFLWDQATIADAAVAEATERRIGAS